MSILDLQTLELPTDDAAPIDDSLASVNSTLSVVNCTLSTVSTLACL